MPRTRAEWHWDHIIVSSYGHMRISSYHRIIISSYDHIIIWSYHHTTVSSYRHPQRKSVSWFWPKAQQKNQKSSLNPITKERNDLKFGGSGVIFRGDSASNTQKFVAPPKGAIFDFMLTFCYENFILKKKMGIEKSSVGNCLKRVLAKFESDRSHVWGVNVRSKFARKIEICEIHRLLVVTGR